MPIFDQGYQHWAGQLSGHTWRWYAIARHGVRIGMKNWFLRIFIIFAWLPAIGLALMLSIWGLTEQKSELAAIARPLLTSVFGPDVVGDPIKYRAAVWTIFYDVFLRSEMRFSMILIMIVGPCLISLDLRFNSLQLYFSRPLRRIDYFLGKLGVVAWFLAMVLIFPSIIAYLLGLLFSRDLSIIPDTLPLLLNSIAYGAVVCVSAGLLILALSSLSRNSRYIALAWVAVWLVTTLAGEALEGIHDAQKAQERWQRAYALQEAERAAAARRAPQDFARQQEQRRKMLEQVEAEALAESEHDWRPMISYTANFMRIRRHMLGTDDAWRRIVEPQQPEQRLFMLREHLGPQYPWYWSGALLAGLFGISAFILHRRVKSLDRLK